MWRVGLAPLAHSAGRSVLRGPGPGAQRVSRCWPEAPLEQGARDASGTGRESRPKGLAFPAASGAH